MEKKDCLGHRSRLRQRFLINNSSILDYELLEMLLFSANSRKDTKSMAKALLNKFGNIAKIINADVNLLKEVGGIGDSAIATIKLIKEIIIRESREGIAEKVTINNCGSMIDYCQKNIGNLNNENFH